jgi:hypothetical protein
MPLGFAKSTFTHKAAAAAGAPTFDLGFFNSENLGSSDNGAGLLLDAGSGNAWPINNRRMTLSVWIKGTTSDLPTDNKYMLFRQLTSTDSGFFVQVQNNGTECFFQRASGGGNKGLLCFPTNFETDFWDDEWHHLLWYVDTNSTQTASNAFYVDGVAQTLTSDSNGITAAITQHRYGKHNSNDNTTADNTDYYDSRSGTVKTSQLWLDFGYNSHDTDFTKFYDSGPVDMGTDGTGSGLSQPDIYLYQNSGTNIQNGGSINPSTVSVINEGTGAYNVSDTGGPTA